MDVNVPCNFSIANENISIYIYNGLFWFVFPFLTVVANDVGAYFAGITLGGKIFTYKVANPNIYRPITFLKLSPKKTWFVNSISLNLK